MIVASGCSFTQCDWTSHVHTDLPMWDKWPERLGDALDLGVINTGLGGGSNRYAIRSIIEHIRRNNQITTACLLLTEWNRFDLFGEMLNHHVERDGATKELCSQIYKWTTPETVFDETNTEILNLIELCEYKKIKLVIGQSHIGPVWFDVMDRYDDGWTDRGQILKRFIRAKDFRLMGKQPSIIGWPFFPSLGGSWVSDPNNKISDKDGHPDSNGQEFITLKFLEKF